MAVSRRRALALGAGATLGALAGGGGPALASPRACGTPPSSPDPFPPALLADPPVAGSGPSRVAVEGGGYRYTYRVDGHPEVVRGMGYNPQTGGLGRAERESKLDRDLSLMRANGVNTLLGWDPVEFDDLTLDVAAQHGIGVIVPFDFDFRADYADGATRATVARQAIEWVERYRRHPAVRMWGLGNEVLQRTVPPTWCSEPPTPEAAARARAFGRFLVELADRIHALDGDHPILYRDAEDAYVGWIAEALRAVPGQRPWLVYGINAYTPRLLEILDGWPRQDVDAAVLVTEYGPSFGSDRALRADAFRRLWAMIRSRPDYVLGGAAYVWYAEGPEEVDRDFGLVDPAGQAVDDALAAIRDQYLADSDASSGGVSW